MTKKTTAARLREIRERGALQRVATVGAVDLEARTVELSFSSETDTVERWFGIEILGHDAGECDLTRLNNGAPVLWMHNWHDQRGVIEGARIDADRKGRAVVRLSRSAEGEALLQDINDGIVTKVSVAYDVTALKLVEEREGVEVYRITQWTPYEISLVSVPADDSVGVGRSAEIPHKEITSPAGDEGHGGASRTIPIVRTQDKMNEKILRDASGNLVRARVDESGAIISVIEVIEEAGADQRSAETRGRESEQARSRALAAMGNEYGRAALAAQFITENRSVDELQRAILADFASERARNTVNDGAGSGDALGLSEREIRSYSLMNAVRALANPNDRAAQEAASFEIECSRTAAEQYGREARGLIIPADILGSRAFNAGGAANTPAGATSGSNLVATDHLGGSFIEMLRKKTTIMRLGTVLGGLVGNVEIPKQSGGASAYWLGENEDATEGTPVIGQIGLNPKTVGAYTDISRRLLNQSSPDAERIVFGDINAAMAQAIDFAGYYGTGANNQPTGIKNYNGINAVDFAAANPTFAEVVKMESEISSDNADVESMAYVMNALMRGHLKTTPKFGSGTEATIWEPGNTVNGYRAEVTNQVAAGDVFFGNYADLIIAMWGGLDLIVDPYSLSKSGGLRIVAFQDVDFVLRRLESICYGAMIP